MKVPISLVRGSGIRICAYMDDLLVVASSERHSVRHTAEVQATLEMAGFTVNIAKSELTPTTKIKFLGMFIDTVTRTVTVPKEKLQACLAVLSETTQKHSQHNLTARHLARFIGKIGSLHSAIPETRMRLVYLQRDRHKATRRAGWEATASLSIESRAELRFWTRNLSYLANQGRKFRFCPPEVIIHSDASNLGFGAAVTQGRPLLVDHEVTELQRPWTPVQMDMHINWKELHAACQAVIHFATLFDWREIRVQVRTDNTVTVAYLNRGGGKVPYLNQQIILLHEFCRARNIDVEAGYIEGALNTVADRLSREIPKQYSEWVLKDHMFQAIEQRFGKRTIDLFATTENAKVPQFVSLKPERTAIAVDAFTVSWSTTTEQLYANPPFAVLPRLLQKVRTEQATMVLVAPIWPSALWWPSLIRMVSDWPLILQQDCCTNPQAPEESGPTWVSAAFPICGNINATRGFQQQLKICSRYLSERELVQRMLVPGSASVPLLEAEVSRFVTLMSSLISRTL